MTEADVWRSIITTLRAGIDAQGLSSVVIQQAFQPLKQGVEITDSIYLHKVTSKRYGHQGDSYTYNDVKLEFDLEENYWIEATYQINAVIKRDITDSDSLTAYDVLDICGAVLQSKAARQNLLSDGIGILRIGEIRNPFSIDDHDQYDQDSSLDFILTYNQTYSSIVPIADPIDADIHRI